MRNTKRITTLVFFLFEGVFAFSGFVLMILTAATLDGFLPLTFVAFLVLPWSLLIHILYLNYQEDYKRFKRTSGFSNKNKTCDFDR